MYLDSHLNLEHLFNSVRSILLVYSKIKLDGGPAFLLFLYVVGLCLLQGQQGFDFDNYLVKG